MIADNLGQLKAPNIYTDIGVTQGSILGSVLFLLYVNDIVNNIDCDLFLYASDTTVIVTGKNDIRVQDNLQKNIVKLCHWFNMNSLYVNIYL